MLGDIHQETGFKISILPIRYLGVPLVTRRLTARDYAPLVNKIIARIDSWSAKLLWYAGSLQLIQSVLFSLQNFLCRNFILPKEVLNRITQLCSGFLWKGKEQAAKKTRES